MLRKIVVSTLAVLSCAAVAKDRVDYRDLSYTSYTFKRSAWTEDQYVGDLKEVVRFSDAVAHVAEYRSPRNKSFSFDVGAAVRSSRNGDTELEAVFGAIEVGGVFIRMESSSASGYIRDVEQDSRFDGKHVIGDRSFEARYLQINVGKSFKHWSSARWGLSYIQASQPAEISLYTPDGAYANQAAYPDALIDPEYEHRLLGLWFDVDNLQASMHDDSGFLLSLEKAGTWRWGYGLTMDMTLGLLHSSSSKDLEKVVKDNYGLKLKYADPTGLGWSIAYRLEYILAHRRPDMNLGVSVGLEGRAFQGFYADDFGSSDSVDSADEAVGQLSPGDNMIFQYGPFIRFAWEM